MRRFAATIIGAGVLALAGCGGSSAASSSPATVYHGSYNSISGSAPVPTPTAASAAQLKTVILGLSDMPTGYAEDRDQEKNTSSAGFCKAKATQKATNSAVFAAADGNFPEYEEGLGAFLTANQAAAALHAFGAIVDSCPSDKVDGNTVYYAKVNLPAKGDENAAIRISASVKSNGLTFSIAGDFYLVRVGSVVITSSLLDLGTPDDDLLGQLTDKAIAKVRSAAL